MSLPQKLLVATDFSECGDRASELALEWAGRFAAELHFVHGVEHMSSATTPSAEPLVATYVDSARRRAAQRISDWADRARDRKLEVETHIIDAPVADGVVRLARDLAADCIVVGTHGHHGLRHLWLGSVAERIVREAACSVLVVRGEDSPLETNSIVLGDDLTPLATPAREHALALARELGARTTVVHSLDLGIPYLSTVEVVVPRNVFDEVYTESRQRLEEAAKATPELEIENVVVSDRAAAELCKQAEQTDAGLVVVGSHSRHGLERVLLGSVAGRVVHRAPCSVLVVRHTS